MRSRSRASCAGSGAGDTEDGSLGLQEEANDEGDSRHPGAASQHVEVVEAAVHSTLKSKESLVQRAVEAGALFAHRTVKAGALFAHRAVEAEDLLVHILPNTLGPVFVLATGALGGVIVAEAGLAFLGLGIPPPSPSWGGMLNVGARGYMEAAPWMVLFPGIALSVGVFAFALLGDALRDVLDPRLRRGDS